MPVTVVTGTAGAPRRLSIRSAPDVRWVPQTTGMIYNSSCFSAFVIGKNPRGMYAGHVPWARHNEPTLTGAPLEA